MPYYIRKGDFPGNVSGYGESKQVPLMGSLLLRIFLTVWEHFPARDHCFDVKILIENQKIRKGAFLNHADFVILPDGCRYVWILLKRYKDCIFAAYITVYIRQESVQRYGFSFDSLLFKRFILDKLQKQLSDLPTLKMSYFVESCRFFTASFENDLLFIIRREGKNMIKEVLRNLGITCNYMGYQQTLLAIELALEDESRMYSMHREIYQVVAEKLQCSKYTVERNIRTVIYRAWDVNRELFIAMAGYKRVLPPSVSEFIAILVAYIHHLEQ